MADVVQNLTLTQQSQSIENNYSIVRILWTSTQDYNSYNNNARTAKYYVTIKGVETEYSVSYKLPKNTTQTILDTTIAVPHNDDGTGSISVRTWMDTQISAGVVTKNASLALSTIPRKSSLSASNGTLGTAQTLTVKKQANSFTHTITYSCGTASGTICTKASGTSVSWTPAIELASQAPEGNSVPVVLTITTYNGSTSVGSSSVTITCNIPYTNTFVPVLLPATSDAMGYASTYGAFVQGHSKLKIDITAYGVYGAWVKSVKTTFDGKTYTNTDTVTTDVITGSGTLALSITVTDSRGRTSTATSSVTVLEYAYPKITALTAKRCNADGTLNPSGSYLLAKFSAEVSSLNGGNKASYYVGYKKITDASHTAVKLDDYTNKYSVTNGTCIVPAETTTSYTVILSVIDAFKQTRSTTTGSSAKKIWSLLKKNGDIVGIAFGKIAEHENVFDIGMPVKFSGGGDCVVEQGEKNGWTYRKWDSGMAECWKTLTHKTAITTGWGALYHGTATTRQSYPFSFTDKPIEQATLTAGSYQAILFPEKEGNGVNGASASACYNVCRPSAITSTMEFYINFYVTGKWK